MKIYLSLLLTGSLLTGAAHAETTVTVDQDDALANVAMEIAASACSAKTIVDFWRTSQNHYTVKMHSKTFETGLKVVFLTFESATQQLAVEKAYVLITPSPAVLPVCKLSLKGIASPN
jgi:hypothetical protein